MNFLRSFSVFIFLSLSGCVTVGPYPSQQALQQTETQLRRKALYYRMQKDLRVNNIGFRILKSLRPRRGLNYNYIGALVADNNKDIQAVLSLPSDKGAVVYGVVSGSPAAEAGVKTGDIILKINNHALSGVGDYYRWLIKEKQRKLWRLKVKRGEETVNLLCRPLKMGYFVRFGTVPSEAVNAAAGEGVVVVTYGLLNFVKNDDELAVVIGHEMAHIAKGHLLKRQGLGLLAALVHWGLSQNIPQGGEIGRQLGGIFNAKFSRDFEREADYFGVIFAYLGGFNVKRGIEIWERFAIELPQSLNASLLADHPTTTERLLRVKALAEKLEKNELDFSKVIY